MISTLADSSQTHPSESLISANSKFGWLTRAGRLSGMTMMVIDSNLQIQFYDSEIAKTLELEMSTDYTGRNLLERNPR